MDEDRRSEDPLSLTREEMREMAHRTVEMLVDMVADLGSEPTLRRATPEEMERRIAGPPPAEPRPYEEILEQLRGDVLPFAGHSDHPAFFAFVPSSGTFPGALGDLIASALNTYVGSWMEGAGLTQLELLVTDWFKDWIGYPTQAAGILVSGGSVANMQALACAREAVIGPMRDDVVAYVSDQGHASVARAARMLGFRSDQLRVLPTDERFRMRADALQGAIAADRAAGRTPLLVVAAAGSTNTGAIDPLADIAELCREQGAWLHVDAAYGGFAALTERGRGWLAGIEQADSVTLDPHKWLYQPYECGCLLVREGRLLREAFEIVPDYLKDAETVVREVNLSEYGLQLSRTSRALKVWISINTFGLDAFRAAIDRSLDLAVGAQERIERSEELELLLPAQLGVVCFRRRFGGGRPEPEVEELNRRLVAALDQSGEGLVSSTRLRGRYAIRMCVLNHTSGPADVERVIGWLERAELPDHAEALGSSPAEPSEDPHGGVSADAAPRVPELESERLRALAPFASLTEPQLGTVAEHAQLSTAAPGEAVVSRWERGRDFYVIVDGAAEVSLDGEHIRDLGVGDFFGELAALDWGAGFGYTRLAAVVATAPTRLLALSSEAFNGLVKEAPGLAEQVQQAVAERLPRA
jgi:glutamate/tyrosine decarboxylase-like PLP-dependent enzyme